MFFKFMMVSSFFLFYAIRYFIYQNYLKNEIKFYIYFFGFHIFNPNCKFKFLKFDFYNAIILIVYSAGGFFLSNYLN